MTRYRRKDPFHQRAKREGYRSRAAYKLMELQRAHRLLRPGDRVVDLGCWPGGWLQVAGAAVGPRGRVVGIDLKPLDTPPDSPNTVALTGDLTDPSIVGELLAALGDSPADVLLSDAAPKLSGVRPTDRAREEALLEAVAGLMPALLRPGGGALVKLLESPEAAALGRRMGEGFEFAKIVKPRATRRGSSERYLLGRGFRGAR